MSDDLYPEAMLRLAERGGAAGRLERAGASATVDNPLCGDRVTVDVRCDAEGRIAALGHAVRGCVLCRAAAAVLGAHATGQRAHDLEDLRTRLRAGLRAQSGLPSEEPWSELAVFEPVSKHRSRHECVLLPFDAVLEALAKA